jgi:hypothetical protein
MIEQPDKELALRQEVYREVLQTWRYEVDSYWQRNNYFSAFETAAIAGCWYVVEHSHPWVASAFSILGATSAVIWLITSVAVHKYVNYWWNAIKDVESSLSLGERNLNFATKHQGSGLHPSVLVQLVPCLFIAAWLVVLIVSLHYLCTCLRAT